VASIVLFGPGRMAVTAARASRWRARTGREDEMIADRHAVVENPSRPTRGGQEKRGPRAAHRPMRMFEFQARVGVTKHIGGQEATDALANLCHVGASQVIADIGCGIGASSVYLAASRGCRVVAVDRLPAMIARAQDRRDDRGMTRRVDLVVADALALPFTEGAFDAVIVESVTAFAAVKDDAAREYARVARDGGWVGLNEATWLVTPVPPEMGDYLAQEMSEEAALLDPLGWIDLLFGAGLTDVDCRVRGADPRDEARTQIERLGWRTLIEAWVRSARLLVRDPSTRRFAAAAARYPRGFMRYFGYGLYVGRKPSAT
jgi:SAM-dependent methyltransferase